MNLTQETILEVLEISVTDLETITDESIASNSTRWIVNRDTELLARFNASIDESDLFDKIIAHVSTEKLAIASSVAFDIVSARIIDVDYN
jgi:glutathione peroxidase-family protein